jgi:hypothetical protein
MKLLAASVVVILFCLLAVACESKLDPSFDLKVGDCIEPAGLAEQYSVKHVSCSAPGALRVVAVFDASYKDWPGQGVIEAEADRRCPSSAASYFVPTKKSWEQGGDREIVCLVEAY